MIEFSLYYNKRSKRMANIKSAKKRIDVAKRNTARNKSNKSALKTQTKKFVNAVNKGEIETAEKILPKTTAIIDSSVTKGAIHKNSANRRKSILAKKLYDAKQKTKTVETTLKKVESPAIEAKPVEAVSEKATKTTVAKKTETAKKTTTKSTSTKK